MSIILEVGGDETIAGANGDPIMENDPLSELLSTLSRSYSFGSSGNEHYNFTSRDSRTHLLDSLPPTDSFRLIVLGNSKIFVSIW